MPIVIEHPPSMPDTVLPVLEQRLVDIALVELGVAQQRNHAPLGPALAPTLGVHVVLHQAGKAGDRYAQSDRTRGKIDIVLVFGARGIGLGPAEAAKVL